MNWNTCSFQYNEWYVANNRYFELAKDIFQSLITSLLMDRNEFDNPTIEGRVKDKNGCISKFKRKYLKDYDENDLSVEIVKERLTDLIGIRIICLYEDDIPPIEEIIRRNFKVIGKTDKTSLLSDTQFGYKGLHYDLMLSEDRGSHEEYRFIKDYKVEVQIRTIIQHAWSTLDHKIKYKHEIPNDLKRSINRLSAIFEIADFEFIRIKDETKKYVDQANREIDQIINEADSEKTEKHTVKIKLPEAVKKLDAINFHQFMCLKYPAYNFYEYKTQHILNEIFEIYNQLTLEDLLSAFSNHKEFVEQYSKNNIWIFSMNPYTELRHILYLHNPSVYSPLLSKNQFDGLIGYIDKISESRLEIMQDECLGNEKS